VQASFYIQALAKEGAKEDADQDNEKEPETR
jgi:hypothetical protein